MSNTAKASEQSGFLDGQQYLAAFLYEFVRLIVGNGVYANELATTATTETMQVTHGAGHAWINGVLYKNDTPFTLPVATADGSLNRYDSLMVRLDLSANEAYALIVQGAYAATPTPPAVTRTAEIYDLKICDIYIPAGCTRITQAQITDTRADTSVCGVPMFPVEHLDTSTFYAQMVADLAEFKANQQASFTEWDTAQRSSNLEALAALVAQVSNKAETSTTEIEALLQELNQLISGDAAGQLVAMVNETNANLASTAKTRAHLFTCTLAANAWTEGADGPEQTVTCDGLTANTTGGSPFVLPTDSAEADEAENEALALIAGGETLAGSARIYCREEAPETDITIYFWGVEANG